MSRLTPVIYIALGFALGVLVSWISKLAKEIMHFCEEDIGSEWETIDDD